MADIDMLFRIMKKQGELQAYSNIYIAGTYLL